MAIAGDNPGVSASASESPAIGLKPAAAASGSSPREWLDSALGWVRDQLTTTPGRFTLVAIVTVVGALVFGLLAWTAERSRHRAAQAVATQTEPLLVQAVNLYASLSDANATAATTFLKGGLEQPAQRQRDLRDLQAASAALATLTRQIGSSPGTFQSISTITSELPVYSGLVESARANNRQGLPVGAAYLRQASNLLSQSILPAANQLYTTEATRLNDDYRSGTSTAALVAFLSVAVLSLALLLLAQRYLTQISNRRLNIPIVVATLLVLALSVWGFLSLLSEQNGLATAQLNGSDPVEVLSAMRILASRAQSDESLTLVARGGDQQLPRDFDAAMAALMPGNGQGGVLGEIEALSRRTGTDAAAAGLAITLNAYRAHHAQISALEGNGHFDQAIALAVRSAQSQASPADRLSTDLTAQIDFAQRRFAQAAAGADSSLAGLSVAIPALTLIAAVLALLGLRQRISEYR
jgi:hypothetical protein